MAKHDFQYGRWNYYTLQCGTIMTLISPCGSGITTVNSPSGSTLQCGKWLWDDMPFNTHANNYATFPRQPLTRTGRQSSSFYHVT